MTVIFSFKHRQTANFCHGYLVSLWRHTHKKIHLNVSLYHHHPLHSGQQCTSIFSTTAHHYMGPNLEILTPDSVSCSMILRQERGLQTDLLFLSVSFCCWTASKENQWGDTRWWGNKCDKYSRGPIILQFNKEVPVLLSDWFWLIACQGRYSVSESDARRQGRDMNMMNPTLI